MDHRYSEITLATAELAEIEDEEQQELARLRARFAERKAAATAKIEAAAANLVLTRPAGGASEERAGAVKLIVHEPDPEPLPHVPRRKLRLLKLLAEDPDAEFVELARAMYNGRTDRAARGGLSAEFSGLKTLSLVEPVDKGKFKLTPLALRVLAQQEQGTAA